MRDGGNADDAAPKLLAFKARKRTLRGELRTHKCRCYPTKTQAQQLSAVHALKLSHQSLYLTEPRVPESANPDSHIDVALMRVELSKA